MTTTFQQQMASLFIEKGQHTPDQQILIVSNVGLLMIGIKNILLQKSGVEVHITTPSDEANLLQTINQCQPDVIILDESAQIITAERLLSLLPDYFPIRLVCVRLEDAQVKVYDRKKFVLEQPSEFISTVINH